MESEVSDSRLLICIRDLYKKVQYNFSLLENTNNKKTYIGA